MILVSSQSRMGDKFAQFDWIHSPKKKIKIKYWEHIINLRSIRKRGVCVYFVQEILDKRMALVRVLELRDESIAHLDRLAQALIQHDRVDHGIGVVRVLVQRLLDQALRIVEFSLIDLTQRLTVQQIRRGRVLVGQLLECKIRVLEFFSLEKKKKFFLLN